MFLCEPGRTEIQDREVRGTVREAGVELLHLHRAACRTLSGWRHAVVAVEDADSRTAPHGEQARPSGTCTPVTGSSRRGQVHSDGTVVGDGHETLEQRPPARP